MPRSWALTLLGLMALGSADRAAQIAISNPRFEATKCTASADGSFPPDSYTDSLGERVEVKPSGVADVDGYKALSGVVGVQSLGVFNDLKDEPVHAPCLYMNVFAQDQAAFESTASNELFRAVAKKSTTYTLTFRLLKRNDGVELPRQLQLSLLAGGKDLGGLACMKPPTADTSGWLTLVVTTPDRGFEGEGQGLQFRLSASGKLQEAEVAQMNTDRVTLEERRP